MRKTIALTLLLSTFNVCAQINNDYAPVVVQPAAAITIPPNTMTTMAGSAFVCVGNAPGWNLTVAKDLITYSSNQDPTMKIKSIIPVPAGDLTGKVLAFAAKDNTNRDVTILINRSTNGCTNGIAGQMYPYEAFIIFPNQVFTGCCNPR